MNCPDCKTANADHARFCRHCGCDLQHAATTPAPTGVAAAAAGLCAHCEAPLRPGAAFCGHCGTATQTVPSTKATSSTDRETPVPPASKSSAGTAAPTAPAASCPHCEAPLRPGAAFCGRCGKSPTAPIAPAVAASESAKAAAEPTAATAKAAKPIISSTPASVPTSAAADVSTCKHCAASLRPGAEFCAACGTPVNGAFTAVDATPATEHASLWDGPTSADEPRHAPQEPSQPSPPAMPLPEPATVRRHAVAAKSKQPPLLAVVLVAALVVVLLVGGIVWWRLRDSGSADVAQQPAAVESQAAPTLPDQTQPEPVAALPFLGEWLVEKDFDNPGQLPDVGIIRFSADRFRFKGTTQAVTYPVRGDGAFGIRFGDEDDGELGDEDPLTISITDTDHLLLSSQEFSLRLVRRDSTAGQAFLAKANTIVPTAPPVAAPAPKPASNPAAAPVAKAAPSPVQLAINASLDEGRRCMASNKYDCAISSANAVLRLAPRNAAALTMKREAEAAQARALSEIEIR